MARLTEKPGNFREGDPKVSASKLNSMIAAGIRELAGGGGVNVEQFGDRNLIRQEGAQHRLPDITNYLAWAVVVKEYDDYLLCAHYQQPDDGAQSWVPYTYDATRGATSTVTFYVAKPVELQRVAWDGLAVPGSTSGEVYAYGQTGIRNAGTVPQSIQRDYAPGDLVYCARGVTGLKDPNGVDIFWTDINVAARRWEDGTGNHAGCALAGLETTDCLLATGPYGSVILSYDMGSGKWVSAAPLHYPGGSGIARFWFSGGSLHFSLVVLASDKELLDCGDGCFTGGPLTGHIVPAGSIPSCSGQTFQVCVSCTSCAIQTACCGNALPPTLYVNVTSPDCPALVGCYQLTYKAGSNSIAGLSGWNSEIFYPQNNWSSYLRFKLLFFCDGGVWRMRLYTQGNISGPGQWGDGWGWGPDAVVASIDCADAAFTFSPQAYTDQNTLAACAGTGVEASSYTLAYSVSTTPCGGTGGDCFNGACGSASVSGTLTATTSGGTGVYAGSFTYGLPCHTSGANHYWRTSGFVTIGGVSGDLSVVDNGSGVPALQHPGIPTTVADTGYVCYPFAATFHVASGGNTMTVTVTG